MWKIVKNKNGTKRWLKMSSVTLKNRTKYLQEQCEKREKREK